MFEKIMNGHTLFAIFGMLLVRFPAVLGVPAVRRIPPGEHIIPRQFLVQVSDLDAVETIKHNLDRLYMQNTRISAIQGVYYMLVSGSDSDADKIRQLSIVTAVEPNMKMFASSVPRRNKIQAHIADREGPEMKKSMRTDYMPPAPVNQCYEQEASIVWGLDRIDQRLESGITKHYIHGSYSDGQGVVSYVIDSGVNVDDADFEGRAIWGFTAPGMDGSLDLNGHGTHVAGTLGSATYGVAKKVEIVAVKVLNADGEGDSAGLIDALSWVVQDHITRGRPKSVMNLSLGFGGISSVVDHAIQQAIDEGITTVVAAGNEYDDACAFTPAHIPDAITVGASDVDDYPALFSNSGECLDLWAPGVDITSLFIGSDPTAALQGTSMASPHVAGVVARYLSATTNNPTPAEVAHWVTTTSTADALHFYSFHISDGSPNRLLYMDCAHQYTTSVPIMTTPTTTPPTTRSTCDRDVAADHRSTYLSMLLAILCTLYINVMVLW